MKLWRPGRLRAREFATASMMATIGLAIGSCGGAAPNSESAVVSLPSLPAGYALRLDRPNRDPAEFLTTSDGGDLRVETGPAGIIYRPDQLADTAPYTASARFTEIGAPVGHREGFGLFIGGQDLENDNQRYTYFLVRGDGRYLIKRRDGELTAEITDGWEPSAAVHVPAPDNHDVVNELTVAVNGELLRFLCNDELVAEMPVGDLDTQGVVGVRVNHNLEVRVQDLRVTGS